jgi:glycine cleavage system H protein
MEIRSELKYSEEHEWVLVEGDVATIGISDFAQDSMGDVVFVELPEVGDNIDSGQACGVVESVKAVSDIYSPVSGEIVEVNEELPDSPESINTSPYDAGWIAKIKLTAATELDGLMDADAYRAFVAKQ